MIFAVLGILKQRIPIGDSDFESAVNQHLAQSTPRIVTAGYLRGPKNERIGVLALIEADSFEKAQAYLDQSPFSTGEHYEHAYVANFDIEFGRLS